MKTEMKTNKGTHDYLGALADALGKCRPYEAPAGILVGSETWVEKAVREALGNQNHPILNI